MRVRSLRGDRGADQVVDRGDRLAGTLSPVGD
jgi:hypothetical protein